MQLLRRVLVIPREGVERNASDLLMPIIKAYVIPREGVERFGVQAEIEDCSSVIPREGVESVLHPKQYFDLLSDS